MRMRGGAHEVASFSKVDGRISTKETRPMAASSGKSFGANWCQAVDVRRRSERVGLKCTVPGGCLSAAGCPHWILSLTRRICFEALIKTTYRPPGRHGVSIREGIRSSRDSGDGLIGDSFSFLGLTLI